MSKTRYNTNMIRKILGVSLLAVFAGSPFLAIAGPCDSATYDVVACSNLNSAGGQTGGGGAALNVTATIKNPIMQDNFSDFVSQVTATAVEILMPFVVLAFIWSGFLFVKAQGNETELKEAKKAIWWSIIGAFILMGAWGFSQIIKDTVTTITS